MAKVDTTIEQIALRGVRLEDYLQKELQNSESELFLLNGELYKIIHGNLRKSKCLVMELLHDVQHDLPINLHDLLYENHKFFWYSMEFYQDYISLYELLKQDISLQERKAICLELIKIYEKLLQFHIVYFDWHSKNLLFQDNLKLLDIDSGKITRDSSYDAKSRRYLFMLCLSVLIGKDFDFDFDFDFSNSERSELLEQLVNKEEVTLSQFIPLDFSFMKQEIESYTSTMIDCKKELVLKRRSC